MFLRLQMKLFSHYLLLLTQKYHELPSRWSNATQQLFPANTAFDLIGELGCYNTNTTKRAAAAAVSSERIKSCFCCCCCCWRCHDHGILSAAEQNRTVAADVRQTDTYIENFTHIMKHQTANPDAGSSGEDDYCRQHQQQHPERWDAVHG